MVILLSALAVIAAAILLGAWFLVGGGFALIYAAMACAVLSMVLLWAAKWIGSTTAPPPPVAPSPLAEEIRTEVPVRDEIDDARGRRPFPIADYEHLWVTQILPLLPELDDAELAMVEARERGARHRGGVLDAIEAERTSRSGEDGHGVLDLRSEADVAVDPVDDVDDTAEDEGPAEPVLEDEGSEAADDERELVATAAAAGAAEEEDDFERAWGKLTALDDAEQAQRDAEGKGRPAPFADLWEDDEDPAATDPEVVAEVELEPEVEVEVEPVIELDEPVPPAEADEVRPDRELVGSGAAGATVRTFLGRVSAPITLDHAGDRLP